MNTTTIMNAWQRQLQTRLPALHLYQVRALAALSLAAAQARHCHLSRLAAHVPTAAQPHSARRRLLRWLGNPRLDVTTTCEELAAWLQRWNTPTARLHLLLDETPLRNEVRVLKVSVSYGRRALPLLWCTYPLSGRDQAMPATVLSLLRDVHRIVQRFAPQAKVLLLADRGLCWPQIMRFCQRADVAWDYLLRAQGQTHLRYAHCISSHTGSPHTGSPHTGGPHTGSPHTGSPHTANRTQQLAELVSAPGEWWCGRAQVFRKAGWFDTYVVAYWPRQAKATKAGKATKAAQPANQAWLLVTSLPPTLHCCRWYARRIWQEQSFRDEKSHGFCWHQSQVRDPARVNRLLLILAVAQLWLMVLGQAARQKPWRERLGLTCRATRRLWSLFRSGWHLLTYALHQNPIPALPCELSFAPP